MNNVTITTLLNNLKPQNIQIHDKCFVDILKLATLVFILTSSLKLKEMCIHCG